MDCRVKPGNDNGGSGKYPGLTSNNFSAPRDQEPVARGFVLARPSFRARKHKEILMSPIPAKLLFGLGLASFIIGSAVSMPAFAADKISLFKVITSKDEIVIGLTDADLAQVEGQNAGGIAKMLVAKGSMSVWQYAVHKSASGELEQAPLHKIGLIASDSLRVEPYPTPLKVLPIDESKK